jgi:hypothetical protein
MLKKIGITAAVVVGVLIVLGLVKDYLPKFVQDLLPF